MLSRSPRWVTAPAGHATAVTTRVVPRRPLAAVSPSAQGRRCSRGRRLAGPVRHHRRAARRPARRGHGGGRPAGVLGVSPPSSFASQRGLALPLRPWSTAAASAGRSVPASPLHHDPRGVPHRRRRRARRHAVGRVGLACCSASCGVRGFVTRGALDRPSCSAAPPLSTPRRARATRGDRRAARGRPGVAAALAFGIAPAGRGRSPLVSSGCGQPPAVAPAVAALTSPAARCSRRDRPVDDVWRC